MTLVLAEAVGAAVFLLAPQLISLFSDTPAVIDFGARQARVEALFFFLLALSHACAAILRGAGRPVVPMTVMLSVWCVFRILYITVMLRFVPDISVLFSAYPLTWAISSVLFLIVLLRKDWTKNARL